MYFTSNRTGSVAGSEDIWVSTRQTRNLEIIFSSNRPNLTGDIQQHDMWVATRESIYESWHPVRATASEGQLVGSSGSAPIAF